MLDGAAPAAGDGVVDGVVVSATGFVDDVAATVVAGTTVVEVDVEVEVEDEAISVVVEQAATTSEAATINASPGCVLIDRQL